MYKINDDHSDELDMCKLEEQAAEMLKDLHNKRREKVNILKELELTKSLIEQLKLKLHKDTSELVVVEPSSNIDNVKNAPLTFSFDRSNFPPPSPVALVMTELKQVKQNLSQSTNDLESIRASVDSETGSEGLLPNKLERTEQEIGISSFEAKQFMKMAEAAKTEVLRAMCEIEETKTELKMIEMRWAAAKKLEEAKATEAFTCRLLSFSP
ncbi:hypothetical protein V2J09_015296 [Rumex salicifolius]